MENNSTIDSVSLLSLVRGSKDLIDRDSDGGKRQCWVCLASEEDDRLAAWVQPCRCIGTSRWVHQTCLLRWVDEKQKGNSLRRVNCPQCQTDYIIVYPPMGQLLRIMEGFDTVIRKLSPFLAAGTIVGSLYWTAVTYGAITVLQVVGHKEGLELMENCEPFMLLVALPAIPAGLVLGRMFRWEDMVLRFIQNRNASVRKFPLLSLIFPMPEPAIENDEQRGVPIVSDNTSATRIFCGALLMPTISTIVGRLFFDSIQNNFHRALIGGLTFVACKGVAKIYYKQKQFVRRKQRSVLDYNDDNLRRFLRHIGDGNEQHLPTFAYNINLP